MTNMYTLNKYLEIRSNCRLSHTDYQCINNEAICMDIELGQSFLRKLLGSSPTTSTALISNISTTTIASKQDSPSAKSDDSFLFGFDLNSGDIIAYILITAGALIILLFCCVMVLCCCVYRQQKKGNLYVYHSCI